MYQRKEGDGSLFTNGYKQNEKHPDYKGELLLGGVTYEIAGWKKAKQDGSPWLSLRVQPKRERTPAGRTEVARPQAPPEFDSEIPF